MGSTGLKQRIKNLREFIADGKLLHFAPLLLTNLQGQLTDLEAEHTKDTAKRKAFYNSIKIQNCKKVVQKCSAQNISP